MGRPNFLWIPGREQWRKRVGVEPTGDRVTCRPPVLKTGTITGPHALPQRNHDKAATGEFGTSAAEAAPFRTNFPK